MKKTLLTLCAIAALGIETLAQTGPGSNYWIPQATGFATPSRGIRDIDIIDPNVAWAVTYDGAAGAPQTASTQDFTRTINGGTTWTAGTIPGAAGWTFANISAISATQAWVSMYNAASGTRGRIYMTNDGGATWTQQATTAYTNTSDSFLNIVHMFDANNGWTQGDPVGGYFEMYTTTDGGQTWTRVPQANIPAPIANEWGIVNVYTTVGNNTIYFGTNKGRVLKSVDAGLNWTVTGNTNLTEIHDVAFSSPTEGLAREGSDLMRTIDGGITWTPVQYTGTMFTSDLKYVPGTTNTYVSTGAATGASGSSYSTDGGQTWTTYDTGFQRTAVAMLNATVGYAGGFNQDATNLGIFKFNSSGVISGINNAEFSKHLQVFPNPTNGTLNINLEKASGNAISVAVMDALGRTVFSKTDALQGGAYRNQLELRNLTKGVYMLKVQTGQDISIRKIIVE